MPPKTGRTVEASIVPAGREEAMDRRAETLL
jgi:hypothetical protein